MCVEAALKVIQASQTSPFILLYQCSSESEHVLLVAVVLSCGHSAVVVLINCFVRECVAVLWVKGSVVGCGFVRYSSLSVAVAMPV